MNYFLDPLKKYAVFDGRATRTEYWMFILISLIITAILQFLDISILYFIYAVGIFIPSLAVGIRRLHDTNHSGWWYFIIFIPVIGFLVLLFFLASDSQSGDNQYGPNPKNIVTPTTV